MLQQSFNEENLSFQRDGLSTTDSTAQNVNFSSRLM